MGSKSLMRTSLINWMVVNSWLKGDSQAAVSRADVHQCGSCMVHTNVSHVSGQDRPSNDSTHRSPHRHHLGSHLKSSIRQNLGCHCINRTIDPAADTKNPLWICDATIQTRCKPIGHLRPQALRSRYLLSHISLRENSLENYVFSSPFSGSE